MTPDIIFPRPSGLTRTKHPDGWLYREEYTHDGGEFSVFVYRRSNKSPLGKRTKDGYTLFTYAEDRTDTARWLRRTRHYLRILERRNNE